MKHNFHVVDIYLLDVHTTVRPLLMKHRMREGMEFLIDPDRYNQQYTSRQALQTGPFRIKPLTYNSRQYNHFWKNYMNVWPEKGIDYWKLQLPFTCEPTAAKLGMTLADDNFQVRVRPAIFVSSLGWSTNLTLQLKGNMRLEQIRKVISRLRSKDETGHIFELGGERLNLSGVYKHFSSELRQTLYKPSPPVARTLDTTNLHRHFIISLTDFTGSIYSYKNKWWNEGERMTNSDQAMLHSILHGRPIDVKEFAYMTRSSKFSVIRFTGPDLALSYFGLGTLIFLQRSVRNSRKNSMLCLGSNIRSCSMMTLMFLYFHSQAKKFLGSDDILDDLLKNVEENLRRMPQRYTNAFCNKLYRNHSDLERMRSLEDATGPLDVS